MAFKIQLSLISAFLIGCSNPNDANIDTMKAAVQQGINDINCRKIQSPHRSYGKLEIKHASACESLDRMTEEGILIRKATVTKGIFKSKEITYQPTDEYLHEFKLGERAYTEPDIMFCPGIPKVTEIISFTLPAEKNGMKVSMVSFSWVVDDLSMPIQKLYDAGVFRRGYSKNCNHYDPFYTEVILEGSSTMPVVLTNEGWKPAKKYFSSVAKK